jgi:hypothetical protein
LEFGLGIMSDSFLLHRQRPPQDLQQLRAWYKVRDHFLGKLGSFWTTKASLCEHLHDVSLTKLFDGRDVVSREEARRVFLGSENDPRALLLCRFAGGREVSSLKEAGLTSFSWL